MRTVARRSAAIIAVLYTTTSVYAGGQGGSGGNNVSGAEYPGTMGDSTTGKGGDGGSYDGQQVEVGGDVGLLVPQPSSILINVTGGEGGGGNDQSSRLQGASGGGGGGTGIATSTVLTSSGIIIGGRGGDGDFGVSQGAGGGGGGGAGVATSSHFTNIGTVIGGAGGNGVDNASTHEHSGGGGGGAGVYVVNNKDLAIILNTGTITGGRGGDHSAWPADFGAAGGEGEGGAAGSPSAGGTSAQGGVGVIGQDISVVNDGKISGGIGGTGGAGAGERNAAVVFLGGINNLTLTSRSVINGIVRGGGDDSLKLQNTLDKEDRGQSGGYELSAGQFQGFESLWVYGGRWTVGDPLAKMRIIMYGGALVVTKSTSLDTQHIFARGGALEASGNQTLGQSFFLGQNPNDPSVSGLYVQGTYDLVLTGVLSDVGGLTKNGSGRLTLKGINTYTGPTKVSGGTLIQGAPGGFSRASSRYEVGTDGTLDLGGLDTILAALYNAGTINMNNGAPGTTLTITGDYVGNGGTIVFNTVLGGDDSKTDKLMVGGDTGGHTNVQVVNVGGLGAQTVKGIQIITVGGQSGGNFSLVSSYTTKDGHKAVLGGSYAYTLHQGPAQGAQDGNWYLISQYVDHNPDDPGIPAAPETPAIRYGANVPVYEGYVQTMQALNKLSTLQERVGKRYMTGENGDGRTSGGMVNAHGIWARVGGGHDRLEPGTVTGMKQEINTFILQAGVDGQFYEDEKGKLIAGITGQYGTAHSNIMARDGDGRISTNAWSLGATATWIGNDGFYVDTQGQVTWFESDLNSDTANVGLASGRRATGYALSVETGKRIALKGNWALTPQAQLIWSSINADDFEDVWQANVSVARGNSLAARFGLAASYDSSWQGSDGRMVKRSVYGITNLYREFLGGTRVNISGVDFNIDNGRTWAGIGAGGTYAWADGKYAVYGEGSVNTSLNRFADSYAVKGSVGFKVKW
ncbi:autotransporter outer membrane beta-barrel domain-containing protein [Brucella sp. 2716]|nr:autotransporter outer membrane beta-barrel domain-containing protein [Brucella sp. 2716]UWF60671.1 autotransporter outer membrane beta-barrel domain-containing protein [Brucella sp. 2716]